ncbi:MAG: transposase, partial [Planctomycetaceae bacterium]
MCWRHWGRPNAASCVATRNSRSGVRHLPMPQFHRFSGFGFRPGSHTAKVVRRGTDAEWTIIEPLPPAKVKAGAPRTMNLREVFDVIRTGGQWRLPHDFSPEGPLEWTVRRDSQQGRRSGLWARIRDALRAAVRVQEQREPEPTAGIIDSQSTKGTETTGSAGYDFG